MSTPVKAHTQLEILAEGALWRVVLDAPKGNVLDAAMTRELRAIFVDAGRERGLKAVLLSASGENFCFGASVEEHLPPSVATMLEGFHGLLRAVVESWVPTVAAVRGACLGGGLELASLCQRVVARPDARLGQPEIALGVFAPAASVVLPWRVGRGAADALLLSGRPVDGNEALRVGLVDQLADEPEEAARAWIEENLLPRSASSLRLAARAARLRFARTLDADLSAVERLYLEELMGTYDAVEGLEAFLEKRPPRWRDA